VISALDSLGDTHLILPLSGGDFGVDSGDAESCVQEASQGGLDDGSSEGVFVSDGAVVSSLLIWEPSFRPSQWPGVGGSGSDEEEELLFDSEPWVLVLGFVHDLVSQVSEIVSGWGNSIRAIGLT
jgi:hypothetical protein